MSATNSGPADDREWLKAFARRRAPENFRPLLDRHLPLVYASALRRTGDGESAADVTRAVFIVLARRARRLRKNTFLPGWLFRITALTSRKSLRRTKRTKPTPAVPPPLPSASASDLPAVEVSSPELDLALDRLSVARRDAVLSWILLRGDGQAISKMLRARETRIRRRVERGQISIRRFLHRRGLSTDVAALEKAFGTEACSHCVPAEIANEILSAIKEPGQGRASSSLARRVLGSLAWARWWRRLAWGVPILIASLFVLGAVAWHIESRSGHSRLITAFLIWSVRHEGRTVPGMADPAGAWPPGPSGLALHARSVRSGSDLYQTTNIWPAHLRFTRAEWKTVQPKRIGPLPHFFQPDGTVLLRHPEAQRSGLAGALGFDFNWAHADLEFADRTFTNVAARLKGNGTFLGSLYGWKRAFKVDLNKHVKGQKIGEADELNFNNLINDHSCLSDALAFEFFRDVGVPAPRTAYAYLSLTVDGKWKQMPLGLYVMVEPVDEIFASRHFGSKTAPVFKPVTYQLFQHLGDDWEAYAAIYDLKTRATPEQQRRVIEFARLVSRAEDAEFARRVGEFLDLEAFARFLAGEVLLSSYDSFLSNGQNFYLYLDPRTDRFGFIPWDLDLAWGSFFLLGTTRDREEASIWHPWVGEHRLLERMMAVGEFRRIYRAQLEAMLTRWFVPERLNQRIDEIASVIRSPITTESAFRLRKFEVAVGVRPEEMPLRARGQGADRPAHQMKRFIDRRARSVRDQLDGTSQGVILRRERRN